MKCHKSLWTNYKYRAYEQGHGSLNLIRIFGSENRSKVIELVVNKVNKFGLDLNKDIVASITDAASVLGNPKQ